MLPYSTKEQLTTLDFGLKGLTAIITGATAGIATAIAYLCGSGAAMITGYNLVIDGGFTIK